MRRPPSPRLAHRPNEGGRGLQARGFSLLELLVAAVVLLVAGTMAVVHMTRSAQHVTWSKDRAFARQRALSLLDELRSFVEGDPSEAAASLDAFDDGASTSPVLTITTDPADPGRLVTPDHPTSGNVRNEGVWKWRRRISVTPFRGIQSRDLRLVTVHVYRQGPSEPAPGETMAEISSVVRTVGIVHPPSQVFDVYLLALENVPGWWVSMDAMQPFIESTLADLSARNPGLRFRTHWITRLGYGRDEEYAPYTNEARASTEPTPWTYVYPGRMPDGEATLRYYVPDRMKALRNVDGTSLPAFEGGHQAAEPFVDEDGDGAWDASEPFTDADGDGVRDAGNPWPYALADMHNHCMRRPDADVRFAARVAAGAEADDAPTLRLLLDRMIAEPESFHNAILINLHGELLPMAPVRNVSDPARSPVAHPGWRVVTHPERLCTLRGGGDDIRFRVYGWKAQPGGEPAMHVREPLADADRDGVHDAGEPFEDWNANGRWDAGTPITLRIPGGDFSGAPNAGAGATVRVLRLPGGIDGDGDGAPEPYRAWETAPRLPETFDDLDGDGIRQVAEAFLDLDGNGVRDAYDPHQEIDGDGLYSRADEPFEDQDGDRVWDPASPAETFTDLDGDGRWDAAEPWWDHDGDGAWTPPTRPVTPWVPWDPAVFGKRGQERKYIRDYGEPFLDLDGDGRWDDAEPLDDLDGDGVWDAGHGPGEMFFEVAYDEAEDHTVLTLHGTPLEAPFLDDAANDRLGLAPESRLYDLAYVPCPTPEERDGGAPFARHLATSGRFPKNTARWIVELPRAAVRQAFETVPGAADGDQQDRLIAVETRIGRDLTTGARWPARNDPPNVSRTWAYLVDRVDDVPYSERYQFLGDPRHAPYADTAARGDSFPHGYNWYFDNLRDGTADARDAWLGLDPARLGDGWLGRGGGADVPRLMGWLREALTRSEAIYTTLTGFSYYYLSLGGDVGYDAANGYPQSIPMSGLPFGLGGTVHENSITGGSGTASIRGSRKLVRSWTGGDGDLASGGAWWSKPWLGELYPDDVYVSQWSPWGNLRASSTGGPATYRLVRRSHVPSGQQPRGTRLTDLGARLAAEGCTAFFHIGSPSSTFHHQFASGTGGLIDDGHALAVGYGVQVPEDAPISRPFGLSLSGAGGVGPEFGFTDVHPRYDASLERSFYGHQGGQTGSGVVALRTPGTPARVARVIVNGLDRTRGTGTSFIARYSVISLLHAFFGAGMPALDRRVVQVPRVEILSPDITTELESPSSITVRWATTWRRWDGRAYTPDHGEAFAEDAAGVTYRLLVSADGGATWRNILDGAPAEPGVLPRQADGTPRPGASLPDANPDGDESWSWPTPADELPPGSYTLRIEAHRVDERLHHAFHMEAFHVSR